MSGYTFEMPQRFVFVVTYGRSGSTLIQNLLNALPGYCIRGEHENVSLLLAQAWELIEKSHEMSWRRKDGGETTPRDPWYGAEDVEPDAFGQVLAAGFLREVLRPEPGTIVSGFKEIRCHIKPNLFMLNLEFLRRFFPGAQFIFNTRDHDAVVQSGWWRSRDPVAVRAELNRAEELFTLFIKTYPDQCHAVHYDQYVADPSVFEGVFKFLDEPYDPALVAQIMAQKLDHTTVDKSL